jgi:transposase-like protein
MDMYNLKQVPSEAQIRKYLRRILFGKNVFCPDCRSRQVVCYEQRYRCRKCRSKFSLTSHTWLANMKLPLQQFWLLLWCYVRQVPVRQTKELVGTSEEAVYDWFRLFRTNLPDQDVLLEQIVQLDEAYGKGWLVLMAKQAGTRKVAHIVLREKSAQRHHALSFLETYVRPGSQLNTDGAKIYDHIDQWWPVTHRVDIHKRFEFGQTSEQEGMFGCMRTFIRRMYHHTTAEYAPEYIGEFCVRFSSPQLFDSPLLFLEKTLILVPRG